VVFYDEALCNNIIMMRDDSKDAEYQPGSIGLSIIQLSMALIAIVTVR